MPRSHQLASTLTIRNVEPKLKERLRVRAAQHGHSMEAELRKILRETLEGGPVEEPDLAQSIHRRFARLGGFDLEEHPPVPVGEPPAIER